MFQKGVGEGGQPRWFPRFLRVYQEEIPYDSVTLHLIQKEINFPGHYLCPKLAAIAISPPSADSLHRCLLSLLGIHAPMDIALRQPCLSPHTLNPGHRGQDWGWYVTWRQGICRPTSNPDVVQHGNSMDMSLSKIQGTGKDREA